MVNTLMTAPPTERVGRYPKHTYTMNGRPFAIHPMCIAPVLPAETLNSLYFESRIVTDPLTSPIVGWKQEFFFFYVKMSDLLRDAIKAMFVDPNNADLAATLGRASNSTGYYTAKGGIPWVEYCLERCVIHYFRDADEPWNGWMTGDYPFAQIRESSFLDSLTDKDDMPEGAAIASATDAGDLERLMLAFEHLRAMGLANMTYEDFLRTYGINVQDPMEGKPELVAHFSDWQYPSNTVNPTDGTPSSAVSWVFKQSARERKFFSEPGFIFGVSITRPKVYFTGLAGNAAAHMSRAWDWMPALLAQMPETKLKQFTAGTGPLGDRTTDTDAYWLDMCDLLIHGDQWQSVYDFAAVPANQPLINGIALPQTNLNWKYPTEAMALSFFSDTNRQRVRHDGMVSFNIRGKQIDNTQLSTGV